jgi:hypothetical protein
MAITNAGAPLEETALPDENARMTNSGLIPGLPVQLATAKTKGGLSAVKAQEGMLMDEKSQANVLQNMQRLADEIQNPLRRLNEGMKDVNAWTMYNKAPAFALREEAANTDRSNLYNIRQQQAAFQNAQLQLEAENKRINALMGRGGVGGAGAGTGGAGGLPANVITALNSVNPRNIAAKQAIIDNYYKTDINEAVKFGYNPAALDSKLTVIPELGRELELDAAERKIWKETKQLPERYRNLLPNTGGQKTGAPVSGLDALPLSTRQNNPGNLVDPATGQIRTFPTPQAGDAALSSDLGLKLSGQSPIVKERFGPQVGSFMSPSLLAETWAPSTAKGNSPESTQNYGKAIADSLGMADPTAQIPNTPESLAKAKAAITKFEAGSNSYPAAAASKAVVPGTAPSTAVAAPSAAVAPSVAPIESSFVQPIKNPVTTKDFETNRKAKEDFNKKNLELRKAEDLEGVKVMTAIQAKAKDRDQIRYAAETIIEEAKNNPKAFAYQQQGGPFAMAAALPVVGGAISDVYAAGAGDSKTRQRVNTAADLLGVENTKDLFGGIGARIGAQLMNVGRSAKGVGTDISAEDNLRRATFIMLGVDKVDEQAAAWKAYKDAGGTNGFDFLQSPQNRAIETKYEDILKKQFPSEYEKATKQDNDKFEYRIDPVTGKKQMRKKDNG